MLIQSMLLVATLVVITSTILTSTLLSAKAVLHQTVLAKTSTAMNDATAAFVASMQSYVIRYGTESKSYPQPSPTSEPLCPATQTACTFLATMAYHVTGTTALLPVNARTGSAATSTADNLNGQVDEQRVSATISVQISNATGKNVYATRSRELTARIFNASPYVVVTGSRDVGSAVGDVHSSEGDTAGAVGEDLPNGLRQTAPTASNPSKYVETRITTKIDCINSVRDSKSALGNAWYDSKQRPFGNAGWAFEASCQPTNVPTNGAPSGYIPPISNTFATTPGTAKTAWQKGDEDTNSFPR